MLFALGVLSHYRGVDLVERMDLVAATQFFGAFFGLADEPNLK